MSPDEAWLPAGTTAECTTRPRGVVVAEVPLVLYRPAADQPPVAFADRCPHRLVPLSAGGLDGGRLRCAYHGWEFSADGRCVALPSAGPDATPPPRADLPPGPRVREQDGQVLVHAGDLAALDADPTDLLTNEHPALAYAWHPVALSGEITAAGLTVRLLGREWTVGRLGEELGADPPVHGVQERWGLVWLAPQPPVTDLFTEPDLEDADLRRRVAAAGPDAGGGRCGGRQLPRRGPLPVRPRRHVRRRRPSGWSSATR